MRIVMFYHSLVSDWNHGNAHFLRGIASELISRGNLVSIYEPKDGWSLQNLLKEHGSEPIEEFRRAYPGLASEFYEMESLDLDRILEKADLVLVHEWNDPDLVRRVGKHRSISGRYVLLFHDTHHRAVTDPSGMAQYDLTHYDGVLTYGKALCDIYGRQDRIRSGWVWHEAADTRLFRPIPHNGPKKDVVWIGNWGDDERTAEIEEFLIHPMEELGLKACVYGVRYPKSAREVLAKAGIEYRGWLPNFCVPEVLSQFKIAIHIPRRPYVTDLPGIPTIRVFETLACGIPLLCSPWTDAERLFVSGIDFLVAQDKREMKRYMQLLLTDSAVAESLAQHGRRTILTRHTCRHRVDQLLEIYVRLRANQFKPAFS